MKHSILFFMMSLLFLAGCEDTDIRLAAEAGLDAVKAVTLTDEAVYDLAIRSSRYADGQHTIAQPENEYAQRLHRLIGDSLQQDGLRFNYQVYLSDTVNAFAMADGTIRIYSGLMDMISDQEIQFVVGHEMGHVIKEHIRKKIQLAYAASAVRKGLASQNNPAGALARSQLGGFVEQLMGAQFSQLEEKEADDYALGFMKQKGYEPRAAVTALRKLAALGNDHSFLSSHPAPEKRAQRLKLQLEGKAQPIEEKRNNILDRTRLFFSTLLQKIGIGR